MNLGRPQFPRYRRTLTNLLTDMRLANSFLGRRGVDVIGKIARVKAISDLVRRWIYWHSDRPSELSGKAPSPIPEIIRIADGMLYPAIYRISRTIG